MKRLFTSLLIASAMLASPSPRAALAQSAQATTVRVGWIGDTHFTDMYLMSEEMKDPSLKLQMNKFQLSQDEVNALAANSLDMASMGYIFFLKLLDKGVDVTAVSGVSERGTRLLIRKGVTVNDWSDFKTTKVGVARGSTQDLQFQSCLAQNNIDAKSVNSIAFTNAVDMTVGLEQGAVDAAVMWEPQASQAVLKGIATEFRPVYPCAWSSNGMLVVRTEFLKQNRAAVVSILKGLASAAQRLAADHEFWIATARKFAPLSPEVQALAVKNSGQSVTLHAADLPKMAAIMSANSYLARKLETSEIEAHIDLSLLAEATGKSKDELRSGK
jgi:ABC-type nitrate/sulfonate/bicarbonate transport system substrate-binding protein